MKYQLLFLCSMVVSHFVCAMDSGDVISGDDISTDLKAFLSETNISKSDYDESYEHLVNKVRALKKSHSSKKRKSKSVDVRSSDIVTDGNTTSCSKLSYHIAKKKLLEYAKTQGITKWDAYQNNEVMRTILSEEIENLYDTRESIFNKLVNLLPAKADHETPILTISLLRLALRGVQRVATEIIGENKDLNKIVDSHENTIEDRESEIQERDLKIAQLQETTESIHESNQSVMQPEQEVITEYHDCCRFFSCYAGFMRQRN